MLNKKITPKIKDYALLHSLLLLLSFSSVFSKLSSQYDFLSFNFLFFYGVSLCILGVYALLWQQILKKFNLTTAFLNKSVTMIWGAVFGYAIFGEAITAPMIIGLIIIFIGVCLVVLDNE
jgi:multidrug transporter EmrE-like cation transporter